MFCLLIAHMFANIEPVLGFCDAGKKHRLVDIEIGNSDAKSIRLEPTKQLNLTSSRNRKGFYLLSKKIIAKRLRPNASVQIFASSRYHFENQ